MQIPLKWINELVNIESIQLDDLIEKLTLGGFEVEEIIELEIDGQKQLALDISATANRSDSLSIQGIATEIAALLNQPMTISNYSLPTVTWKHQLLDCRTIISNEKKLNCSTLLAINIENVTDFTVPKWIQQKLISSDIIPENNLSDFQNYILLETGYPFAFYDFDKICSKLGCSNFQLSISNAMNNQKFTALNDITYELNSSNLLLKANNLPLSIAGIIEDKDFQVSETTTSLLMEGTIFNAATIRQQSRNLGLRTDRSARYEKSIKNTYLIESVYRFISLLRISNPNISCNLHTFQQIPEQELQPIQLRYQTIIEILGPIKNHPKELDYLTPEIITEYLTRLNFEFSYDNSKFHWEVEIPHSRSEDITREIDLIEEIGRLHGFNNFITTLPKIKVIGKEDPSYRTRKKITSCLLNLGLNELIHYSLVGQKTFVKNEIQLVNPLLSDCSHLRASLLPSLLNTVQENMKQGNSFIEGFEYGHVFSGKNEVNLEEKEYVAGIFGGIQTKVTWAESEKALGWFEAKGKIEQLFQQLNLITDWQNSTSETDPIMHPYRSSTISLTNKIILGRFGQIHPILANQLAISSQIYLFELDLEVIKDQLQKNKLVLYKEYSLYPKIVKDLSFIIRQDIPFEKLQEALYCNGTKFLSDIHLLDEYRGKSIPEGSTSLCLQFIFQSKEKTLENKDIETIMNHLQFVLTNQFDARIRN